MATGAFRSLRMPNYRTWAIGAAVSNIGTWMQRAAQDWIVLTTLTDHNATSVGFVMALQFGPQVVLLPLTGLAADRMQRRTLLCITQAAMAAVALALGVLVLTGLVQLWHVYVLAALLGCASAFDAPARQTFVADLVGEQDLSNAVALNSTSFNAARLIGPAVAGLLIARVGIGWIFILNAASFIGVLGALALIRKEQLHDVVRASRARAGLADGFRYIWARPDLRAVLVMLFFIGTFGLNFPIFISTMAVGVFHAGASEFGLLVSTMAIGSVTGALLSARRAAPSMRALFVGCAVFGAGLALAAAMPSRLAFGAALIVVGMAAQTFTTTANSTMQLSTTPQLRGRVMAIYLAVAMGTTPIGAPIVGWVADAFGPRWALGVGAAAGVIAACVAARAPRAAAPPGTAQAAPSIARA